MLTTRPNQCVPGQVHDSGRAPILVSVLTPALNRPQLTKYLHIRCFWSPAPTVVVPCTPMPVVSSLSEHLSEHVLHGMCPKVMTFGEPTRNGGFLDHGDTTTPDSLMQHQPSKVG